MSKKELEINEEEIEYTDQQFDISSELADDFIEENIIPQLEEFDYNNPDEEYVPGMATFVLFTKIIDNLLSEGFTVEQLLLLLNERQDIALDRILH